MPVESSPAPCKVNAEGRRHKYVGQDREGKTGREEPLESSEPNSYAKKPCSGSHARILTDSHRFFA